MMISKTLTYTAYLGVAFAQTGPAPVVVNNQPGEWYIADLTPQHGLGTVTGTIGIAGDVEGRGVRVAYAFEGFDLDDAKEYSYHIHEKKVPEDGNCNSTGKHFDKYGVGDDFVCDRAQPQNCQLGDLSGKHGFINFSDPVTSLSEYVYHEEYLSTTTGDTAFFGDLSVVVHRKSDKFRLACGNFHLFYDADISATFGMAPAVTRVMANGTTPYPNATTSTLVVATATVSEPNQISATGTGTVTETDVVTGHAATHTPGSTSSRSSSVSIQTGGAETGARMQLCTLALELAAVAVFALYIG